MNRKRLALCLLLSSAWLGVAPRAATAQLVPLGPEIELPIFNEFPNKPFLAVQPDGAYVVAWDASLSHEVFYHYVAAGRKPADGWPSTIESPENSPVVDAVTAVPRGFDVLWHVPPYEKPKVFYRRHLNLQGAPDGEPILLGGAGTEWVWHVRGNGFMTGWTLPRKHAIAARRLGSSGRRTGPELRLNSRPIDSPNVIVLAVADGGFLAVWLGVVPGPTATAVLRARRFSPAGKPLGPDFDVNTIPLGVVGPDSYRTPEFKVAAAPGGGFAVAWIFDYKLYLRFFDAAGTALGPEIPAESGSPESLAFDKAGNLLLLRNRGDLELQLFDPHGAPLGLPVSVRSEASGIFESPWAGSVAWAGDSWLVTWVAGVPRFEFSTTFVRRFAGKK
jgi:hypothetical protein